MQVKINSSNITGTGVTAGNGGSGIVILKYSNSFTLNASAGLIVSTVTSGSNKISTFTSGSGTITFS